MVELETVRLARLGQAIGSSVLVTLSVVSIRGGMALGHIDAQEHLAPRFHAGPAAAGSPGLHSPEPGGGQRQAGHRSQAFALRRMNRVGPG